MFGQSRVSSPGDSFEIISPQSNWRHEQDWRKRTALQSASWAGRHCKAYFQKLQFHLRLRAVSKIPEFLHNRSCFVIKVSVERGLFRGVHSHNLGFNKVRSNVCDFTKLVVSKCVGKSVGQFCVFFNKLCFSMLYGLVLM